MANEQNLLKGNPDTQFTSENAVENRSKMWNKEWTSKKAT